MLTTLGANAFFGEMALLHPEGRSVASVRVETFCEGYRLSRHNFALIESAHPEVRDIMESVAKLRLRRRAGQLDRQDLQQECVSADALMSALHLGTRPASRHPLTT